jgi:mevalonate kinase
MNTGKLTSFFSNGNLLISGEYFVLAGAKALAVPLKYGQEMKIVSNNNSRNVILWKTNELGQQWFSTELICENLEIKKCSNTDVAQHLQKVLKAVQTFKPELFNKDMSYDITCDVGFRMDWGWGSSSSLTANIASWSGIDAFILNKQISSGSGYDIATSMSSSPLIYQLTNENRKVEKVAFNPLFRKFISFIYLGKKQSTELSIEKNIESVKRDKYLIPLINSLTEKIAAEENVEEFVRCIVEHERIISETLRMKRIKELHFSDFKGEIKSLGAWGGDFAMVVSSLDLISVKQYFKKKNIEILFRFDEIVKNQLTETE